MTVWIYVDTSKQVGDPDHLKVFANADVAQTWFEENDPEGVAFEYPVEASNTSLRFIKQSSLPENDRADCLKINNQLKTLASRRRAEIDLLAEPWRRSRTAWKIALFSNAMLHRFISLADGVAVSWNNGNVLSAVLNARAMVETVAIYWEFGDLIARNTRALDFTVLDQLAMKYLFGTRDEELLQGRPELKSETSAKRHRPDG